MVRQKQLLGITLAAALAHRPRQLHRVLLGVISTSRFRFKRPFGSQWEVVAAGVSIVVIPTLIISLLLQHCIYSGFTSGATK